MIKVTGVCVVMELKTGISNPINSKSDIREVISLYQYIFFDLSYSNHLVFIEPNTFFT